MKTETRLALLLCVAASAVWLPSGPARAQAADAPARQRTLLDSGWRFYRGELPGAPTGLAGTPVTRWRWTADESRPAGESPADEGVMAAPSLDTTGAAWKDASVGDDVFHGRVGFAWFRSVLPAESTPPDAIHFEGVDDNATVYLNGQRLGYHEGWDDPFDMSVGQAWRPGGPNVLAVLVENTAGIGGISGPVLLQRTSTDVAPGPAGPAFSDRSWRTVHLPHDYIIEGVFSPTADAGHGSLPTTTAWYRKTFRIPASDKGKDLWIDFDGVYRDSKVWLNGHFLGSHASGYTSFRYDITPYARPGGQNVLAVHVDPRHFEGWWYEGGGIYRHVWLNAADPVHVAPWGTFVTSNMVEPGPSGAAGPAAITIKTSVENDSPTTASLTLVSNLVDDSGRTVASVSGPVTAPPGQTVQTTQEATVQRPILWSLEAPRLYHLATAVEANGRVLDSTETPFGIRTIRFDPDHGFFLNGKHVEIQGTCNHQDFIGVGIGVPDTLEYWRVKKLKEMGANAWRMSHNPPTPALLDACDQLGMLVMDENRHLGDSPANLAEVASMVQRDRNHPSIIMWSMCNEEQRQSTAIGERMFTAMMNVAKANDPSRPVSCAMNGGWFADPGFAPVEDLLGINYGLGNADRFHQLHLAKPIFGSETASTLTTRGEYVNDPVHVYVTSYNMTDGSWQDIANRPFVAGSFVWTGFDYKGEPTPYQWPSVNSNFGIMDMCGFPKDNYYYYQSWWKQQPIVHLMPHWNWPGKEGQPIRVIAFSNCESVELFLNGKSLGRKTMPRNSHLDWEVPYSPGTLSAKGFNDAGAVTASDRVETTGPPAALRLTADRTTLADDGEDVAPVAVSVLDAQGRVVPVADNLIKFHVSGAGTIAGVGNGNPGDHDPDRASFRHAFNGLCMALVQARRRGGMVLTAESPGLKAAALSLSAH